MKDPGRRTLIRLQHHIMVLAIALALMQAPARANTINVDIDSSGIGYVEVDTMDGKCSLKEAILNANIGDQSGSSECTAGSSGADTIVLPVSGGGTFFTLSSTAYAANKTGLPYITSDITIERGNSLFGDVFIQRDTSSWGTPLRLFYVTGGGKLTLKGLFLREGIDEDGNGGGAILVYNGSLNLIDCNITDSSTVFNGGAVSASNATLTLTGTTLSGNNAGQSGGGLHAQNTPVTINGSKITQNHAGWYGGGIDIISSGTHLLQNSTISDNVSLDDGGGLSFVVPPGKTGKLTIIESIIATNFASNNTAGGGGLDIYGDGANDAYVEMIRSTVSGNYANSVGGVNVDNARLYVQQSTVEGNRAGTHSIGGTQNTSAVFSSNGEVSFFNSTISGNSGDTGSSTIQLFGAGAFFGAFSTTISNNTSLYATLEVAADTEVRLVNTIMAGNKGSNCVVHGNGIAKFVNDWFSDNTCNGTTSPGNIRLGPLQDNGGKTLTHALLSGSAAIDKGDDATCAMTGVDNQDQRGEPRVQGAHCDIGAYEARKKPTRFFVIPLKNGKSVTFGL